MLYLLLYKLFLIEVESKENKDDLIYLRLKFPKQPAQFFNSSICIIILNYSIVCLSEVVSLGFGMQE